MSETPFSVDSRSRRERPKRWLGGYIRWGKKGPTYVIDRWLDGRRYHLSTKRRTERAALDELAAFEQDPPGYRPGRKSRAAVSGRTECIINADAVLDYRRWMETRPRPAERPHVLQHRGRLEEWLVFYNGRDVRDVPLREVSAFLAGKKNLTMRIQALKSFCKWLRTVKFTLTRNEDVSLDLQTPTARATKDSRRVVVEPERIAAVLPHLPDVTRDVMILRLGTGWHVEEVRRFAREGRITRTPGKSVYLATPNGPLATPLLAVLGVQQRKAGVFTRTPIIHAEHLAAAERLKERGATPHRVTIARHTKDACKKAGVEPFWNWHIRHSVVSHAMDGGARLEDASTFVDHFGVDVTRRHYAQHALPQKAVPVLRVVDGGVRRG
jgi:hypothetical protein